MKKLLKQNKGMTLIELVMGLFMMVVIVVSVNVVLISMLRSFSYVNGLSEANMLLDNLANQITNDLAEATEVYEPIRNDSGQYLSDNILSMKVGSTLITYKVDKSVGINDGILLVNYDSGTDNPVLDRFYYKKKTVSFSVEGIIDANGNVSVYILTVIIWAENQSDQIISREYAVRPLAVN